jgi:hypothetical protein
MINREKVSYHWVLYLLNLSNNIFTFCVLINAQLCCCSLLINNQILFFYQHRNYQKECAYIFDKDMQKNGVNHVIYDMCMFLRREIFNAQEKFFDKNDTLAEFPQLCNYERFGL